MKDELTHKLTQVIPYRLLTRIVRRMRKECDYGLA